MDQRYSDQYMFSDDPPTLFFDASSIHTPMYDQFEPMLDYGHTYNHDYDYDNLPLIDSDHINTSGGGGLPYTYDIDDVEGCMTTKQVDAPSDLTSSGKDEGLLDTRVVLKVVRHSDANKLADGVQDEGKFGRLDIYVSPS